MSAVQRAPKRVKLLDDDASSSESEETITAPAQQANGFGINEEYAKRFEHNKKREERHRLEEKYGKEASSPSLKRSRREMDSAEDDEDDDSSEDESEDDDAEFATEDVDNEIMATLNAIRSRDPRVFDKEAKFFKDFAPVENIAVDGKKEKPIYLRDYHRQNLLAGNTGEKEEDSMPVQTYQDEQDKLKQELVGSMHATGADAEKDSDDEEFLVAKSKPTHASLPVSKPRQITEKDVTDADRDPENYLSNFMAARAWLPKAGSRWEAFESDDSEDEQRADDFEEAYNMRFEDPATANEKLQSFARDVGKFSVRRDEQSARKRTREREQEKRLAEKQEREEDRGRLRRLKLEEAEEKLQKIKEAAGIRGQSVNLEDWRDVIEGDFDQKWEAEMERRFGDDYYAQGEDDEELAEQGEASNSRKKHPKKPKWDDEIDINDIVSDFEAEDAQPAFTLSSDDESDRGMPVDPIPDEEQEQERKKKKSKKEHARDRSDAKRAARLERRRLEEMVDSALPLDHPSLAPSTSNSAARANGFRYRATSPTSFGLSARDILFAEDAQLNQFAGLKKLAAFRDPDKKNRDKKKLSKKARLRQWRKDTFGDAEAPVGGFERVLGGTGMGQMLDNEATGESTGAGERKKKKRSRKGKSTASVP